MIVTRLAAFFSVITSRPDFRTTRLDPAAGDPQALDERGRFVVLLLALHRAHFVRDEGRVGELQTRRQADHHQRDLRGARVRHLEPQPWVAGGEARDRPGRLRLSGSPAPTARSPWRSRSCSRSRTGTGSVRRRSASAGRERDRDRLARGLARRLRDARLPSCSCPTSTEEVGEPRGVRSIWCHIAPFSINWLSATLPRSGSRSRGWPYSRGRSAARRKRASARKRVSAVSGRRPGTGRPSRYGGGAPPPEPQRQSLAGSSPGDLQVGAPIALQGVPFRQ